MPWFTRFSRFGDVHLVYSQAAENSCGIASVMMCVFKRNKLRPGASAMTKEQEVYKVYGDVAGVNYDGSAYSFATKLDLTLNKLNCGKWVAEYIGPDKVADRIMKVCGKTTGLGPTLGTSPIIVLVGWENQGAHFVVVDTVRSMPGIGTYATVCDPWDAQLRVTKMKSGSDFKYSTGQTIQINLEGTPQHEYGSRQNGTANGWVVHQAL